MVPTSGWRCARFARRRAAQPHAAEACAGLCISLNNDGAMPRRRSKARPSQPGAASQTLPTIALSAGKRSARRSQLVQCVATRLPVRKPRRRQHEGAGVDRLKQPILRRASRRASARHTSFTGDVSAFLGDGAFDARPLTAAPMQILQAPRYLWKPRAVRYRTRDWAVAQPAAMLRLERRRR
jgi:hypothetical protein